MAASLLLTATAEGQQNLYVYSLDELSREPAVARQLTSTAGAQGRRAVHADSREVFYLEQGRITIIPIETRQARTVAVTAEIDVDFARGEDGGVPPGVDLHARRVLRRQVPRRRLGRRAPRTTRRASPARRRRDEMRRLLNLMVGELNASHMGVAGPGRRRAIAVGGQARAAVRSRGVRDDGRLEGDRDHSARSCRGHAGR